MSNKVKVPGGAFYLGDGLTVDQTTRTVSAGGGGGGTVSVDSTLTMPGFPAAPRNSRSPLTIAEPSAQRK